MVKVDIPASGCSAGAGLFRAASKCSTHLSSCASWVEILWLFLSVIGLLLCGYVPDNCDDVILVMIYNSFMFL